MGHQLYKACERSGHIVTSLDSSTLSHTHTHTHAHKRPTHPSAACVLPQTMVFVLQNSNRGQNDWMLICHQLTHIRRNILRHLPGRLCFFRKNDFARWVDYFLRLRTKLLNQRRNRRAGLVSASYSQRATDVKYSQLLFTDTC